MAPGTRGKRVEDKQHLAKEKNKLGKGKKVIQACVLTQQSFCVCVCEMQLKYKLCLDGQFYFGEIIPRLS